MSVLDIVDADKTKWDYLKEFVPGLDYHKVHSDYRSPGNVVGHIQRAVVIYWAIKEHERTGGIGLEPGAGQAISPWCVSLDYYSGHNHPVYGGSYLPNVRGIGEVLPFKNEVFDFIVSHHSLEHMKDTEKTLREWLRVLKLGGKIAIVMPDKRCPYYKDPSHVSECTPQEFLVVLQRLENIQIIEFNSLKNHFSFNVVIEKSSDRGEIMEKESTEEIKLREQMRTLWQDRVMWTRMLLTSITAGLDGEVDNIIKRLRKNQDDIGDALKPYLEKYLFCWDNIPGDDSAILSEFLFQSFGINWVNYSPPKGLELLSTFPEGNGCHNANGNRKGDIVVGSALRKPLFQGQPVSQKDDMNTDIVIATIPADVVTISKEDNDKTIVVKSYPNSVYIRLNNERTRATLELDIGGRPHEFKFNAKAENGRLNIYLDNSENRNMLTTLLKSNITMSKNFIKARKAGDTSMGLDAEEGLKTNAVSIAAFLSGLNPNWSHKLLETMLLDCISLLREETISHLNKNSDTDLAAHEKIQKHALKIADALTDGIVKSTPDTAAKPQSGSL